AVAVRAPEVPEGALFSETPEWGFGVSAGAEVIIGSCADPSELVSAVGGRPVLAHDAKSLGRVPENLAHDTLLGAYLLEPARRGYPLAELCEERGLAAAVEDPAGAETLLVGALAELQRKELAERGLDPLLREVELPLVDV